ncbi:MAG: cellulase family glycosylhydrolase [Chloroflexales bacterium]|nr:cellulase family glycosylhydrolase [Chloroflexales bacterium]
MRHSTRHIGTLLILLFLVPLVVACGGQQAPAQGGSAGGPTAAPGAPATAAPDQPTVAAGQPTAAVGQPESLTPQPNQGAVNPDYLEFGVVSHLYYTDRERVLQLAQNAGFDWVRQQISWQDIEDPVNSIYGWDEIDQIVDAVYASGRKLLVNIVRSPTAYSATNGLPNDPQTLANFVALMAERYKGKIQAYEIWNEPNLAHETGGTIRPEDVGRYVEMLKLAYTAIKAVDPNALVLAAASSSSGVTNESIALSDEEFYRAMYTYNGGEVRNYFDVQAVHPGGAANPPDTMWPDNPSFIEGCLPAPDRCWNDDETHYFRHIENVRQWMEQYGMGDKEAWITEYGWATPNNTPGYEFGNFVSIEQQAEYITRAISRVHDEYPYVGNMFLWNMNFAVLWGEQGNPDHEQASFGILNADWSPRPSYLAAQSLIAQLKQER